MLLSALIHAVWSTAIKGSGSPMAFNLLQSIPIVAAALLIAPFVPFAQISGKIAFLLVLTGLPHGLYLYFLSRALEHGDLSLVYPIARSTPAVLPFAAVLFLNESISIWGALGIATVVAGMWFVALGRETTQVPDPMPMSARRRWPRPAIVFALATLANTVLYGLIDKVLMVELNATVWGGPVPRALFCFLWIWATTAIVFVPIAWRHVGRQIIVQTWRDEAPKIVMAALISVGGYGLILEAMRTAPASYVVAVRQSSVLFVLALSVIALKERPGLARSLGAAATVVGVALITWAG